MGLITVALCLHFRVTHPPTHSHSPFYTFLLEVSMFNPHLSSGDLYECNMYKVSWSSSAQEMCFFFPTYFFNYSFTSVWTRAYLFYVCVLVPQPCLTLCDLMDCSPPGSSVHGISQARILDGLPCPSPDAAVPP